MKTIIKIFTLTLFIGFIAGMTSCEKADLPEVASGSFELSINVPGEQLKSEPPDSSDILTYHVLLSVINSLGETILDDELIPLYKFGNEFVTERIEMKTGRYQLSKFMIINPAGEVEFAAPLEGSPRAYLVNDPLPLAFSILPDDITKVVPEVLSVGSGTPADFGYASFGAQLILD